MSTELEKIAELKKQIDALEQQVKDKQVKKPEITAGCVVTLNGLAIYPRLVCQKECSGSYLLSTLTGVLITREFRTPTDLGVDYTFVASSLDEYYRNKQQVQPLHEQTLAGHINVHTK